MSIGSGYPFQPACRQRQVFFVRASQKRISTFIPPLFNFISFPAYRQAGSSFIKK
jgi:hypothetical protein